jgi:hypothetical protein
LFDQLQVVDGVGATAEGTPILYQVPVKTNVAPEEAVAVIVSRTILTHIVEKQRLAEKEQKLQKLTQTPTSIRAIKSHMHKYQKQKIKK